MNREPRCSRIALALAAAGLVTTVGVAAQAPSASNPGSLELFGASTTSTRRGSCATRTASAAP